MTAPPPFRWPALVGALVLTGVICLLPTPEGLPVAGHRVLGVLAGAIVLWVTEAVSFAVSGVVIVALLALLVGFAPALPGAATTATAAPVKAFGTAKALTLAMDGFRTSAVILVSGALFLAAAMKRTGLDRRIALNILARVGSSTTGLFLGVIAVAIVLAFFVPSTTARAAALVPIMSGIVTAFALPIDSRLGALLLMTVAHASTIWNVGIKTAAGQNLVGVGLIDKGLQHTITWGEWFVAGAPWAALMTLVLIVVMPRMVRPGPVGGPTALELLRAQRDALGPVTPAERRLLILSVVLLAVWASEGWLHPLDSATAMVVALMCMLLPGIGVMTWDEAESRVPWGTMVLFGVGVSLGGALIETGAAKWTAEATLGQLGVATMSPLAMIATLTVINIVVHQGFASATGLAAALIPIVLAFFTGLARADAPAYGMTLVQLFMVSVGFVLPVNSPQNMVCHGTGAFTTREFLRIGIPLTLAAIGVTLLLAATYWRWIGLLA
ncbi:MAG: anion permease [Gemmatimonadaceae bacterium]|nr:anion permease [Gemmatimonadaceae bacterium]